MSKKQEKEIGIVKDFLKCLKFQFSDVLPSDTPDVIVICKNKKIGVEVTKHFVDKQKKGIGSKGHQKRNYWGTVQNEIEKLRKNHRELQDIHAFFSLNKKVLFEGKTNPSVKDFAKELVSFVARGSEDTRSDIVFVPDWQERTFDNFSGYALMEQYVKQVIITKGSRIYWDANVNVSGVGVDIKKITEIIKEKSEKAKKYNMENIKELWLLIAAPHDSAFNSMHKFPDQIDFENKEIIEACCESPFNKIYFWSSPPHEWARQIWPNQRSD